MFQVPLVLTACSNQEFTCDDGSCISSEKHCNLILDCPDLSDEMDCELVLFSPNYSPKHPPNPTSHTLLVLNLFLVISSVRSFNPNTFSVDLDTTIVVTWLDPRLEFKHLLASMRSNKVNESQVWHPTIAIQDKYFGEVDRSRWSRSIYANLIDNDIHFEKDVFEG